MIMLPKSNTHTLEVVGLIVVMQAKMFTVIQCLHLNGPLSATEEHMKKAHLKS